MWSNLILLAFLLLSLFPSRDGDKCSAFRPVVLDHRQRHQQRPAAAMMGTPIVSRNRRHGTSLVLRLSSSDVFDEEEDEEEVEPGKMRVSEIKAELDLRGVDYADCFDKESLVERLQEARETGRADPKILENFNKQKLEETFKEEKLEVADQDIQSAVANDGTLPGGMTPEQFKKLAGNPEVMAFLQSTKMQEAMTLMMTGGREELEKKLQDDPDLQETIRKLDAVLREVQ